MAEVLLRFRVTNHRSISETAELSLTRAGFRGATPPDDDWAQATVRVAAIYGANASGKTTLLDALAFFCSAIANSATLWAGRDRFPYSPFLLRAESQQSPCGYEADVVIDHVRYTYGFESDGQGIRSEWLHSFPTGRRRVLYERSGPGGDDITFGRNLPGENTRIARLLIPSSLFLSTAANNNHPVLRQVRQRFVEHINFARFDEFDRHLRLSWIRTVLENEDTLRQAEQLLTLADLGITSLRWLDQEVGEEQREIVRRMVHGFPEHPDGAEKAVELALAELSKEIRFGHAVTGQSDVSLSIDQESSGTVAWLAIGVPAIHALKRGDVFVIDEIDSSLHPRLTASLIGMFKDAEINPYGAQLIFTSHDTALLGRLVGDVLDHDEVWFVEKDSKGATNLFGLAEYPTRSRENVERRYLQGTYGAVPLVSAAGLKAALMGPRTYE